MARTSHGEDWWAKAPPTVLRCTAHLKVDGTQCRTEASLGTNVCFKHGATAPAVQAAAATRIQMSVDDAAAQLVAWMNDPNVDMRERVKIAHDLLDRGGLGATAKVLLGVVTEDPVEKLFRSLLSHPDALAAPPPAVEVQQVDPEPVEVECVEEEDLLSHTVSEHGSMSAAPPRYIAEQLKALL